MADNRIDIEASAKVSKASGEVTRLRGAVEALGPAGRKVSATLTGSFQRVESAISKVRKAMATVSFATMWIDAVTNIVHKVAEWRESMRQAEVEAQKLRNAAVLDEQARQVENLSRRYKELCEDIQSAGRAAAANEQAANAAMAATRAQEDAQLDLRMEREVAALDRDDPAYSAKVAEIRQRYAGARSVLNARRGVEDAEAKARGYEAEAWDEDVNASTYGRNAEMSEARARELARTSDSWRAIAGAYGMQTEGMRNRELVWWLKNGGDATMLQQLKGMKPEEIVEYAKRMQADYAEQAKSATATAQGLRARQQESAAKSKTAGALAASQQGMVAAARTRAEAVGIGVQTANGDASTDVAKAERAAAEAKAKADREASARREQEAARAAELARAQSALPGLQARAAGIRAQIDAQNASVGNANLAVFQAQGNLDVAKANGDRGGIRSASVELQAAQEAAWSVQNQADATIKSLTEALRKVNEELKAAERVIANNRKQSSNSFAEAPAGD